MSSARSQHRAGWQQARQRHPHLPLRGPGSPFTHPRLLVAGSVLVLQLSPSPQQQEEGMLPLPSSCLRLEGIHYLPGYRQLSEAIFQLCAFKELIGGEIILSRQSHWRHNFICLPRGLLVLPGDPTARVSLSPHPGRGCTQGVTLQEPRASLGVPPAAQEGVGALCCSKPGLGVPLSCPCPSSFVPRFPTAWQPRLAQHPALNSSPPPQTHSRSLRQPGWLPGSGGGARLSLRPTSPRDSPALLLPGLRALSR